MDGPPRRAIWLAFAALIVLRLVYLAEYVELPFLYGPLFDAQVYLAQANAVRAGQFGAASLLAFSPLYGYLLAALGAHAGSIGPVLLQLALGLANVALIWRITRALFGAPAGLWAAGWYAAYAPLLFFETKIMSETLGMSLLLCALERFTSSQFATGRWRASLGCGVLLALSVLARASLLFCVPWFVLAAPLRRAPEAAGREATRAALKRGLGVALGVLLVLGSYGTLTRVYSGLFVPVILVSNTLSQATRGEFHGDLRAFQAASDRPVGAWSVVEQAEARLGALRRGEPDPALRAGARGIDLLGWARQLPQKIWLTLRDVESSFDYGYYGERSELPALYVPFASFGMLACFAALGVWWAARERNLGALLGLLPVVAGVFAVTTLFHPSTRYRLPLLVVLAPLSGLAWVRARQSLREGRRWPLLLLGALTALFAVQNAARDLSRPGSWQLRVAEAAAVAGDLEECRARLQAALVAEPDAPEVQARARYVASLLPGCGPR
jgi:4-amino-4-deoxy-L-arabinose transferase-like glycosyltransferase